MNKGPVSEQEINLLKSIEQWEGMASHRNPEAHAPAIRKYLPAKVRL